MSLSRREFIAALAAGSGALPVAGAAQELPTSGRELWDFVRQQAVVERSVAWLNTAASGPSLMRVLIEEYRQREARSRNPQRYDESNNGPAVRDLAATVATFLGAQADELTFTSGTTAALSLVANGLDFVADDEIVTTTHEHSAGIYPWLLAAKRRGLKVIQVPLPSPLPHPQLVIDALTGAITPRTRVLSFSHVQCTDGSVLPVRALCEMARARNILTVVDGAQAVGMLPLSLRDLGCDFYAGSFHKWLNGPEGTGFLYLRDAARHRVWPCTVAGPDEWDAAGRDGALVSQAAGLRSSWPASMRKYGYDFNHLSPLVRSLRPAIEFQRQIGPPRVAARIRELAWYLRMQVQPVPGVRILSSSHPEVWSGILAFQLPGIDSAELATRLRRDHGIAVSSLRLPGANFDGLRAATHVYNTHDDIDRLAGAVRRLAA
jgi:selenocysteine lyase/cysteine desulfurase